MDKQCLDWEDLQVLAFDAVRLLVALGWVTAGFLYELGWRWSGWKSSSSAGWVAGRTGRTGHLGSRS